MQRPFLSLSVWNGPFIIGNVRDYRVQIYKLVRSVRKIQDVAGVTMDQEQALAYVWTDQKSFLTHGMELTTMPLDHYVKHKIGILRLVQIVSATVIATVL